MNQQTEQTRQFFDMVAGGWTTRYERDMEVGARKARFADAVQARVRPGADILDFGCGSGDIARHLAGLGHRLTGYDLSAEMIAQARRADPGNRIAWIARDTADRTGALPMADASFDTVVASSVLEYVPDAGATLHDIARVLRPGGYLFATVPDMRDPHRHRERWLRLAARTPILSWLLDRSRWHEGAAYLRISVNRLPPKQWHDRLQVAGLTPGDLPESAGPLLLLTARKGPDRP